LRLPARSSGQDCLISGFCSSGRDFAPRFLQPVPRGSALAFRLVLHLHQVAQGFHPQAVGYAQHTGRCAPAHSAGAVSRHPPGPACGSPLDTQGRSRVPELGPLGSNGMDRPCSGSTRDAPEMLRLIGLGDAVPGQGNWRSACALAVKPAPMAHRYAVEGLERSAPPTIWPPCRECDLRYRSYAGNWVTG